jgi:hypothetical protein
MVRVGGPRGRARESDNGTGWPPIIVDTPVHRCWPATGKSMQLPGVSICEIRNGPFTSVREYSDLATVAAQLGIGAGVLTDTPGNEHLGLVGYLL